MFLLTLLLQFNFSSNFINSSGSIDLLNQAFPCPISRLLPPAFDHISQSFFQVLNLAGFGWMASCKGSKPGYFHFVVWCAAGFLWPPGAWCGTLAATWASIAPLRISTSYSATLPRLIHWQTNPKILLWQNFRNPGYQYKMLVIWRSSDWKMKMNQGTRFSLLAKWCWPTWV